jgi:hypothetical protein
MAALEPVSVALKFGFLIVLYLFLLWVARSALKDLRRESRPSVAGAPRGAPLASDATAMHSAAEGLAPDRLEEAEALLKVEQAPGLESGSAFDLVGGAVVGRGDSVDIQLEDPFASTRHARISWEGSTIMLEDLGSTNGTYLNGEPLRGPAPLHVGDRIRIGDSEFSLQT